MSADELARLQAEFPGWHVWMVPTVVGPDRWCAMRHGEETSSQRASSAEQLRQQLRDADGAP